MHFHFALDTKASPQQVLTAFTDFTARRPSIWEGSLDPEKYEVREVADTSAIVREGSASPSVWAVERYDWSEPGHITWTAIESNFCQPGSGIEVTITEGTDGGSHLEAEWHRQPKGLFGVMIVTMARIAGPRMIPKDWAKKLDQFADTAADQR